MHHYHKWKYKGDLLQLHLSYTNKQVSCHSSTELVTFYCLVQVEKPWLFTWCTAWGIAFLASIVFPSMTWGQADSALSTASSSTNTKNANPLINNKYKIILHVLINVQMNSANIQIIDCYSNYSNVSEVFEYWVWNHTLNVITRGQRMKQWLSILGVQFESFMS